MITRKRRLRTSASLYLASAFILSATWLLYSVLIAKRLPPSVPKAASPADRVNLLGVRPPAIGTSLRTIYPYSVIRGGVYSVAELDVALRNDPVVAAHYADLDRTQLRVTRSPVSAAVYVSYRKADRVYWTSRKVHLAAGELLLTDGVHLARARCGNRISLTPQGPVAPTGEPSETDLDTTESGSIANDDVSPDEFSPPKIAYEVFPAIDGNWPGGSMVPDGSVESMAGTSESSEGGAFFSSPGGSPSVGFTLPPVPELKLPSFPGLASPSTMSDLPTVAKVPLLPVGPTIIWLPTIALLGDYGVGIPTGVDTTTGEGATSGQFGGTAQLLPTVPGLPAGIPTLPGVPPGSTGGPGTPANLEFVPPPSTFGSPQTLVPGPLPEILLPLGEPPIGTEIPEPATAALLLSGIAIVAARRFCGRRSG